MKMKITDLMDLYEAPKTSQVSGSEEESVFTEKETANVKESKKKNGWKEYLAMAAALAIIVAGGFGLRAVLKREALPGTSDTPNVTMSDIDTHEQIIQDPVDLNEIDRLLTIVAEQGIQDLSADMITDARLVQFVFQYYSHYEPDALSYAEKDGFRYQTLTLEQVNDTLNRLLGKTVAPSEGTNYAETSQIGQLPHLSFQDGLFWWPHQTLNPSRFAVSSEAVSKEDGSVSVSFDVYEVNLNLWTNYRMDDLTEARNDLESLRAAGKLMKTRTGSARLLRTERGLQFLSCQISPSATPDPDLWSINTFLLNPVAVQGIRDLDTDLDEEYELAQFAHIYFKLNDDTLDQKIVYQSDESGTYETVSLGWVNIVLESMFGKTISPAENTDYTVLRGDNYAQHETYHDGCFWWPAADGEIRTRFSRCTGWEFTEDGSFRIAFMVYEADPVYLEKLLSQDVTLEPGVDLEDWVWSSIIYMDDSEIETHIKAGEIRLLETGTALVQSSTKSSYVLLQYKAEEATPLPVSPSTDEALLSELEDLFSDPGSWYARAVTGCFSSPEQADLFSLFYVGLPDEIDELTEQERKALADRDGFFPEVGCDRLPKKQMDQVLKRYLGVGLADTTKKNLSCFTYLEETDCYYHFHGDTNEQPCRIKDVRTLPDGTVLFTHEPCSYYPTHELVPLWTTALRRGDDGEFRILSNLPGEWVVGQDVEPVACLFDCDSDWILRRTSEDGTQIVENLFFGSDCSIQYRNGDPDSEYSYWESGCWWIAADDTADYEKGTLCMELWQTEEMGNRTGEPYTAAFRCSFTEEGNLVLTQLSERGFSDHTAGTELTFQVLWHVEWYDKQE